MAEQWPKQLVQASGPMRADKLLGAAEGMGAWGEQCRALYEEGLVPPDMMCGLTLFILSNQPRDPERKQKIPGGGGGVAGGVWVRERFMITRPLHCEEPFVVQGAALGRHVHKGRRYGTNQSRTFDAQGRQVAANLTTGLLQYEVKAGLEDGVEGVAPDDVPSPAPDWEAAQDNPALPQLRELRAGQVFGGYPVLVSLAMMAARDTKNPDNPIHSDPELARKAGLSRPIAGGSHVLSFALEVIMSEVGRRALLHGAAFDVRWKAPVYADEQLTPYARVRETAPDRVVFDIEAILQSGATAMTGSVVVPLS